jgi:hypothetical protein
MVRTRSAVNNVTEFLHGIKIGEELPSDLIVSNLRKFERNSLRTITWKPAHFGSGLGNNIGKSFNRFTGWLSISNGNDQNGFSQLVIPSFLENEWFDDLGIKLCA